MRRPEFLLLIGLTCGAVVSGQPAGTQAPIAGNPKVEVRGTIEKIGVAQGQRMPFLEVKTAGGTTKVVLGSVRYLMEQNFNPKAGDEVVVKGYKMNDFIVASTIELPATGKVLKLRDSDGRPVWMRGRSGAPGKNSSK